MQAQLSENNGTLLVSNAAQNATFTWYLDGQALANQQGNTLTFQENGNYQCIVTDPFGCSDTTNLLLIDVGLANIASEQPKIFPNPAKDYLNVSLPSDWLGSSLQIIDLLGKVVYVEQASANTCAIPLHAIQSGTYLIQLTKHNNCYQQLICISSAH